MTEVLSSSSTPLMRHRNPVPWTTTIAIGTAAVLVATVGSAVAVGRAIGGGQQPEDVLPSTAIAVVKVDLNPPLGQQKAVYDLSKKFKNVKINRESSVKDDLLSQLFNDQTQDLNYTNDIKPWLGDRVAIAAVPDKSASGVTAVAAVQYTDKAEATKTLDAAKKKSGSSPFAFAFSGDYVVIATTQAQATTYAKAEKHLSDNSTYTNAVDALEGDQIVVAWADVKGVYGALPKDQLTGTPFADLQSEPSGSFVVGAHADSHFLEITGKAVDVSDSLKQYGATSFGNGTGHNLLASMPIDATAALEITGLGDTLTKAYAELATKPGLTDIESQAKQFGLTLPDDIKTVLGTDLAVAIFGNLKVGDPAVAAHVLTDDPDGAVRILNGVPSSQDNPPFAVKKDGTDGYFIGTSAAAIAHATNGTLGDSAPFRRALPDAKDAGFAVYVSIGRALGAANSAGPELENLEAFGMTADPTKGEFRIRLTVR
jgi:hypothetical protein